MQSLAQMRRVLHPYKQQSTMLGSRISISDVPNIFLQNISFSEINFSLVPMGVPAPGLHTLDNLLGLSTVLNNDYDLNLLDQQCWYYHQQQIN